MRVLVIGKTGQLARALADLTGHGAAIGRNAEMTFLGRTQLDLCAPHRVANAIARHAPEVVINAAAYTAVDRAESERETACLVNGTAVGEIARATAAIGAPLIHISTDYVFDGRASGEYREADPVAPLNVYGASKLAGEQAALAANPRCVVLRTSWVYSPWGRNFLTTMLDLAAKQSLRIVGDQTGKPTSALDLADACLSVARSMMTAPEQDPRWGLYHYAGAGACSWAEFAEGIFGMAHRRIGTPCPAIEPIGTAEYPTPAERPMNSALDCVKFEAAFGLLTVPRRQGLGHVLDVIATERRSVA
jgi:dTDP-4-dehydrorhamnose reductase